MVAAAAEHDHDFTLFQAEYGRDRASTRTRNQGERKRPACFSKAGSRNCQVRVRHCDGSTPRATTPPTANPHNPQRLRCKSDLPAGTQREGRRDTDVLEPIQHNEWPVYKDRESSCRHAWTPYLSAALVQQPEDEPQALNNPVSSFSSPESTVNRQELCTSR